MSRRFHCELSPVCTAPRQGCVCFACATVRRGVKDDDDAEDIGVLLRQQRGHPRPRLRAAPVNRAAHPSER